MVPLRAALFQIIPGAGSAFAGGTVPGATVFSAVVTFGTAQDAANSVMMNETAGCITFEGATSDGIESRLCATDPTSADQTYALPDAATSLTDGRLVAYSAASGVVYPTTAALTWGGNATFGGTNGLIISQANASIDWGSTIGALAGRTATTPDTFAVIPGSLSNTVQLFEYGDIGFDFQNGRAGSSAATTPGLIISSADQSRAEYLPLNTDSTGAAHVQASFAEVTVGGFKTGITEGSAIAIVRSGVPTSTNVYGANVSYTVYDLNGANYVAR